MSRCESYVDVWSNLEEKERKEDGSSLENQEADIPPLFLLLVFPDHSLCFEKSIIATT